MKNYAIEIIDANLKQLEAIRIKHEIVLDSKAIGNDIKSERQKELNEINERIFDLTKAKGIIQEALRIEKNKKHNTIPNRVIQEALNIGKKKRSNITSNNCPTRTEVIERGDRMIRVRKH